MKSCRTTPGLPDPLEQLADGLLQLSAEGGKVTVVGRGEDAHDHIEWGVLLEEVEHVPPYELPEAAFHQIPRHPGVLVLGHDEPDTRERVKGSGGAHVQ